MTTATQTMTLAQIINVSPFGCAKVRVNGHVWVAELTVGGRHADLTREVRVSVYDRRTGITWKGRNGQGAGWRRITIRRPLDLVVEVA